MSVTKQWRLKPNTLINKLSSEVLLKEGTLLFQLQWQLLMKIQTKVKSTIEIVVQWIRPMHWSIEGYLLVTIDKYLHTAKQASNNQIWTQPDTMVTCTDLVLRPILDLYQSSL